MDLATRYPESLTAERRASTRYPLTGEAKYRIVSSSEKSGPQYARVADLSSDGLLLECRDGGVPLGSQVEVMIPWMARHGKAANLQCDIVGHTVRKEGNRMAIKIEHSAFRFDANIG